MKMNDWLSELEFTKKGGFFAPNSPLTGKSVIVLGGGPSLLTVPMEDLKPFPIIATNNAYQLVDRPCPVVALDRRYFEWHGKALLAAGHTIISALRDSNYLPIPQDSYWKMAKDRNGILSEDRFTLAGTNSGHAAVNLAYLLGASRIFTAGFDMGFVKGKSHWHAGHKIPASEQNYRVRFRPPYEKLVYALLKKGIPVLSLTPTKANVPFVNFNEAIEELKNENSLDHP